MALPHRDRAAINISFSPQALAQLGSIHAPSVVVVASPMTLGQTDITIAAVQKYGDNVTITQTSMQRTCAPQATTTLPVLAAPSAGTATASSTSAASATSVASSGVTDAGPGTVSSPSLGVPWSPTPSFFTANPASQSDSPASGHVERLAALKSGDSSPSFATPEHTNSESFAAGSSSTLAPPESPKVTREEVELKRRHTIPGEIGGQLVFNMSPRSVNTIRGRKKANGRKFSEHRAHGSPGSPTPSSKRRKYTK